MRLSNLADYAVVTMGGLFRADPRRLESGEIEDIIRSEFAQAIVHTEPEDSADESDE